MRKRLAMLFVGILLGIGAAYVYAGQIIFGSPVVLTQNTATNSAAVFVQNFLPAPVPSFTISNASTLQNTNGLLFLLYFSMNGTNSPLLIASNSPSSTAPSQWVWNPSAASFPFNYYLSVTNTNSGGVSVYVNQN